MHFSRFLAVALCLTLAAPAIAQGTNITLGAINADPTAPLEITADSLSVDQDTGVAVFQGNVRVGQGDLRLAAGAARVIYNAETGDITSLDITGGVTFVTATEAAESQSANYNLASGQLVLSGDVLLTQGASAISSDRMTINLEDGTANMDGRVRTVFQQGDN